MTISTNGEDSNSQERIKNMITTDPQEHKCPTIVHETVCTQAEVTITPSVVVGTIETFCMGRPVIGACPGTLSPTDTCSFTVSQSICVQVPLTFSATAIAVPTGIVCGTPALGPCSTDPCPVCT
jgi:hypothetical protein